MDGETKGRRNEETKDQNVSHYNYFKSCLKSVCIIALSIPSVIV